jgi:putative transposase
MRYDPQKHHRRSVRLKDYDYAQQGAYFVTICTEGMKCSFGVVDINGEMNLNQHGIIVRQEWERVGLLRRYVELDAFVVMPNHVHGIIFIIDDSAAQVAQVRRTPVASVGETLASPLSLSPQGPASKSLSAIIGGFKSAATREINRIRHAQGRNVWQRSFHDVIIRNEKMLNMLRQYIDSNPARWANDRYYAD